MHREPSKAQGYLQQFCDGTSYILYSYLLRYAAVNQQTPYLQDIAGRYPPTTATTHRGR